MGGLSVDIYLTNLTTSDRLRFPMLPTEISVRIANQFGNYTILGIGEVKLPSGSSLDTVSWSGIFPGRNERTTPMCSTGRTRKRFTAG